MKLLIVPLILILSELVFPNFKNSPMFYTRVREAYAHKEKAISKSLQEHNIHRDSLRIYLQAFKTEKKIEVWAKNINDTAYVKIRELEICEISGNLGPKRRTRDLQVPEGFYRISDLNPYSKYYLSLEINYPNASDSIRGVKGRLGNEIFIHGDCVSSGCLAITNDRVKELFIYCVEAQKCGQEQIGITIYPAALTDSVFIRLNTKYKAETDKISLWADLKKSYDFFQQTHIPATVKFLPNGTHEVTEKKTE